MIKNMFRNFPIEFDIRNVIFYPNKVVSSLYWYVEYQQLVFVWKFTFHCFIFPQKIVF